MPVRRVGLLNRLRLRLLGVELCGGVCCPDGLNPTHAYWISGFKGIYAILETLYSLANSLASGGKRDTN